MTLADMKFRTSFIKVMRPLVVAMKLMEGENPRYISGALVCITVNKLQSKLKLCKLNNKHKNERYFWISVVLVYMQMIVMDDKNND